MIRNTVTQVLLKFSDVPLNVSLSGFDISKFEYTGGLFAYDSLTPNRCYITSVSPKSARQSVPIAIEGKNFVDGSG